MAYWHMVYGLLLNLVVYLLYCTGVTSGVHGSDSDSTDSGDVVKTRVGDDAVLPCEADPNQNPKINRTEMAIEWSRPDLPPHQYVHFQRNGKEVTEDKNSSYNNRTSLFKDELKKGNVSLKLSRVKSSDAANYTCFLSEISQKLTVVQLIVVTSGVHGSDSDSTDSGDEVSTGGELSSWVGVIACVVCAIMVFLIVLGYKTRQRIQDFVKSVKKHLLHACTCRGQTGVV